MYNKLTSVLITRVWQSVKIAQKLEHLCDCMCIENYFCYVPERLLLCICWVECSDWVSKGFDHGTCFPFLLVVERKFMSLTGVAEKVLQNY